VRNGPNPQFALLGVPPFDGDGMVHALYIEDGVARYRNRWIESKGLLAERARGAAQFGGLAELHMPDAEVQAEAGFLKNTANTNTVRHAGRILALLEACPPTQLSRELETLGEWDYDGRLVGPMTAHPKIDPVDGELHFFGYSPFPPYLRYHVADASGELVHSTDIELPNSVMMHDFALTEHHVLFLDSPALFDVSAALAGGSIMRWAPEEGTRLGVLPRRGNGDQILVRHRPVLVHLFNAWDEGDRIEVGPLFSSAGRVRLRQPQRAQRPCRGAGRSSRRRHGHRRADRRPRRRFPRQRRPGDPAHAPIYNCQARTWEFEFEFHGS
jgi:carotenoid cleavage dioxygenase